MNIVSNISNSSLFLILIISIAVSIAYLIYFYKKRKDEFERKQRFVLATIRFFTVFFISVLLLTPIVESLRKSEERPILILAVDNSESMLIDSTNATLVNEIINKSKAELESKFKLESFVFGEKPEASDQPDFNDQQSNYTALFNELDKQFYNLNVGAIVVVGDGIYNEGANPGQLTSRLNAPIHTIGIGDTLTKTDQSIIDVTHNPNVFLNNEFPIEVEALFTEFPAKQSQLSIYLDGKLVHSENIEIPQANYYFQNTYNVKAEKSGLRNVLIALSPITSEQNTRNNRFNFTIEVHDNKKEILILSQGPHPDIGAIVQTLSSQANLNIKTIEVTAFNGNYNDYDLIVLNQLPSLRTQQLPIFNELKTAGVALLAILGPNTSISALNNLDLDFQLAPSLLNQESTPYFNQAFPLFNLPSAIKDVEQIYPPLLCPYTEYTVGNNYSVLAYQTINGIEMNYPLIVAGNVKNRKTGIILGEGIWRWRIFEYQNYENQNTFNQLISNLFSYLVIKEEREQFRIQYDHIFAETTPVKFKAQVFNEIYEPVVNAEVRLSLTDSSGNELSYLFDNNQNEYNLNIGYLKPGNYNFEAIANFSDFQFTRKGNFNVEEVNLEHQHLQANFNVLSLISSKNGGQLYSPNNSDLLIENLKANATIQPKVHTEKNIHELIDLKWFAMIILLLFSLEWFLRKFWGSY